LRFTVEGASAAQGVPPAAPALENCSPSISRMSSAIIRIAGDKSLNCVCSRSRLFSAGSELIEPLNAIIASALGSGYSPLRGERVVPPAGTG
jgi:hypothetical protein